MRFFYVNFLHAIKEFVFALLIYYKKLINFQVFRNQNQNAHLKWNVIYILAFVRFFTT